ncbi:VirB3 family type IV secretion system protein [Phenylobacterium sp.]|uniref:VirB3 family type IV secretion system protein n=1 Tax=Phenylobacterium sp. TaxID=1871053 RepID=UPI002E3304CB|nr:VirB3 family type IV secretion system protein [Phenylobacterium sp.]HEX2562018.1 VirB3 family type IV secretion system protein [Phenylobacterium sp.]
MAGALTQPVLMAGLPRDYAILNGTLATVIGLALKLWPLGLAWWAAAHGLGLLMTRADPSFLAVLRRHLIQPSHLDA